MIRLFKILLCCVSLLMVLSACGGGGGGGGANEAAPPTTATLKLLINDLPVGVKVGALQVHFNLPAGVFPATLSGNDASGSVVFSGNAYGLGSLSVASYVASLTTIGAVSSGGLIGGEYITFNCSITPGSVVSAASFPAQATIDSADDTGVVPITGLTVPITVTLQ